MNNADMVTCPACGLVRHREEMLPAVGLLPGAVDFIRKHHPNWDGASPVCRWCAAQGTAGNFERLLREEVGPLSPGQQQVLEAIRSRKFLSARPAEKGPGQPDRDRHAERLTALIGSWVFSGLVLLGLLTWVLLNLIFRPFEPYPVIVLAVISAVLASLAALQGPVILINQRLQRAKDRQRAEYDYQVNLKAELEIRALQEQLDRLFAQLAVNSTAEATEPPDADA
jgi:uncharacterized membrane protein